MSHFTLEVKQEEQGRGGTGGGEEVREEVAEVVEREVEEERGGGLGKEAGRALPASSSAVPDGGGRDGGRKDIGEEVD